MLGGLCGRLNRRAFYVGQLRQWPRLCARARPLRQGRPVSAIFLAEPPDVLYVPVACAPVKRDVPAPTALRLILVLYVHG